MTFCWCLKAYHLEGFPPSPVRGGPIIQPICRITTGQFAKPRTFRPMSLGLVEYRIATSSLIR